MKLLEKIFWVRGIRHPTAASVESGDIPIACPNAFLFEQHIHIPQQKRIKNKGAVLFDHRATRGGSTVDKASGNLSVFRRIKDILLTFRQILEMSSPLRIRRV